MATRGWGLWSCSNSQRKGRELLRGIHRVDSLTLDPHKWLFQPYDVGCVLIRNSQYLSETFRMIPEYIRDTETNIEEKVNFGERGIELSRRFRALKVWLSLKHSELQLFVRQLIMALC